MLGGRRGALPDGDSTRMTTSSSTRVRRRLDRRAMPTNVPLNEEGFEDADEFFRSSPQSGPSSSRHQTPAARRSDGSSPSTVRTNRSRRSRISDMVADEDDEAFAENLLADDDDDDLGGTPRLHFPSSPSRLPPKSPSVGFDAIPSPSMSFTARRSTIGVNYRPLEPRLSPTTPLRNEVSGLHSPPALEADEDDMGQGMEVDISAEFEEDVVEEVSFERRTIEDDGPGEAEEEEEEEEEEQINEPKTPQATNFGKVRDPGLRTSVHGKSKGPIPDEEDDEDEDVNNRSFQEPLDDVGGDGSGVADTYDDYSDAGGPEGGFEVNDQDDLPAEDDSNYDIDNTVNIDNTADDIDHTMDDIDNTVDNTVDTVDSADITADVTGFMDDGGDEEGDVSLERQAIEEEDMDEEDEGDVTAISQERTPRPKSRPKKKKDASTPRSPADLPKPKRSRISQLPDSEFIEAA
ncbi:hypothetical protein A1Q1_07490 [Trichosporon asahii var. asahii CBS 2479]|uniref:Uncharacterized protein n=1 Tax=Trichosporon asahii var. asahii (strain ATCC 90039 / CBS 2479 / JCM 2466 / KCTC 7840 / NBRC 103889/ NCYC 2677 / UAMH 7654) TaxID=1186058 RepID=J6F2U2_TRIAS|nr:hypothetical protein A1Q1_07490 [Trichosporon asahii var. asahii CBS 2479]EJT51309.1 hypothetical protein A1Q1_07490 [Trichosporon asahii var. asahii CBS 2479]